MSQTVVHAGAPRPDAAGAVIRVGDVRKASGSVRAARGVSFEVALAEIFGLLGAARCSAARRSVHSKWTRSYWQAGSR